MADTFEKLCAEGERIDALLAARRHDEAIAGYLALLRRMRDSKTVDAFVLAKLVLGVLFAQIAKGDVAAAHRQWTAQTGDRLLDMGIEGIEAGQLSEHDTILFMCLGALLRSLGTDQAQALTGVNQVMSTVCKYATHKERAWLEPALSNWRHHLREIFEGKPIPPAALVPLEAYERGLGRAVTPGKLFFPAPSPWVIDWVDPEGEPPQAHD